jgi:hypothetical protein
MDISRLISIVNSCGFRVGLSGIEARGIVGVVAAVVVLLILLFGRRGLGSLLGL